MPGPPVLGSSEMPVEMLMERGSGSLIQMLPWPLTGSAARCRDCDARLARGTFKTGHTVYAYCSVLHYES